MEHDHLTLTSKTFPGAIKYGKCNSTQVKDLLIVDYELSRKRADVYRTSEYWQTGDSSLKKARSFNCCAAVITAKGNRPISMNHCDIRIEDDEVTIKNAVGSTSYPMEIIHEISMYLE